MPEFASVINVSTLNGSNGFRLDGETAGDEIGRSVAAGDINGDGFSDLIVGAGYASPDGDTFKGAAYVVFGASSGPASRTLAEALSDGDAYRFIGETSFDYAGFSVASAGDVNGDGIEDLLFGAKSQDLGVAASDRGAAYLVFGGTANLEALDAVGANDNSISLADLTAATGFRFGGAADKDYAGWSVSSAGDVNGDGTADLLIGAPFADVNGGTNNGASYIVFGGIANLADLDDDDGTADGKIDLGQISAGQGVRLDGGTAFTDDQSGKTVAAAGDVNGDGFADVLVGAPFADSGATDTERGIAYLVFGRPTADLPATLDLSTLSGLDGVRFIGVSLAGHAGTGVASAGDVNGDGLADLVIGAPFDLTGEDGAAYVVFGKTAWDGTFDLAGLDGTNGFRLDGLRIGDRTGYSVSSAGDVNGDGFDDILVAAKYFDRLGELNSGAAYVVFGGAHGFAPAIDLSSLDGNNGFRIEGKKGGDKLGDAVAAGDVNSDGFGDIIIGAHGAANNGINSGSTYVIFGHRALSDVIRIGTDLADRINGGVGDDVIKGLTGNDTLLGWEGDDTIWGGSGRDGVIIASGNDELHGGSGRDTLSFERVANPISIALASGQFILANGDVQSFASFENILGGTGADNITGDAKANRLEGGGGKDTIAGGAGDDTLMGGAGQDRLNGNIGSDQFAYGALADSGITGSTRDLIVGFIHAEDKIDVRLIDARAGGGANAGDQHFIFGGTFSIGHIQVTQPGAGADTLVEFNTDNDSAAEMSILLKNFTASTLDGDDFLL